MHGTILARLALVLVLALTITFGGARAGGLGSLDELLFVLGDVGAERRVGAMLTQAQAKQEKISTNPALIAWARGLFDRLVAVAPKRYSFTLQVIEEDTLNAYALPGGGVFLYTGMIDFAASDDEIACILGHEIGHVTRRHGMKRIRNDMLAQGLIGAFLKDKGQTAATVGGAVALFRGMSYSRQNEDEADSVGMEYAQKAGFDPAGAYTIWSRMRARFGSGKGLEGYLSTHPSHEARIANTRVWLERRGLPLTAAPVKTWPPRPGVNPPRASVAPLAGKGIAPLTPAARPAAAVPARALVSPARVAAPAPVDRTRRAPR